MSRGVFTSYLDRHLGALKNNDFPVAGSPAFARLTPKIRTRRLRRRPFRELKPNESKRAVNLTLEATGAGLGARSPVRTVNLICQPLPFLS